MALRSDRQRAASRAQSEPLQYQDQAAVHAELAHVTLISDTLDRKVRVRVSANALKSVDHRGGLDAFLLKANDVDLAPKMLELKRQIVKKKAATATST